MHRQNFGGNIQLKPSAAYLPETEQEVLDILNRHHGQRIRCVGRLHSWSRAVECNDVLIDLRQLNHVNPQLDGEFPSVSVGAGCQLKHLLAELERLHNWTLPSLGLITEQTVAGAVSTGTHGSGRNSLSQYVLSVRIAQYAPQTGRAIIREIDSGDELRAARCSLGCLGVILSVTMLCRTAYNVEEAFHEHQHLEDVLKEECEYPLQQFFLVPWRWTYMSQYRRETDRPKSKTAWLYHWYRYVTIDLAMLLLIVIMVRILRVHAIVPWMFRRVIPTFVIRDWHVMSRSTPQLVMEHELFRHIEVELFVQKSKLKAAMHFVQQVLCIAGGTEDSLQIGFQQQLLKAGLERELDEIRGICCHHFPICVRKVLTDDTLISMTSPAGDAVNENEPEAWYAITFTSYSGIDQRANFEKLARFLSRSMASLFAARPHWGKLNYLQPHELQQLYPGFEAFRQLCHTHDPDGHFQNAWTAELLAQHSPHH